MPSLEAFSRRVRFAMARTFQFPITGSDVRSPSRAPRPWMGKDGLKIPRAADPLRLTWELRFLELLLETYRVSLQEVRVVRVRTSLSRVEHANGVRSQARFVLYRNMLAAGEPVPPLFVERRGERWFIRDGNHRTHAAREAGIPWLVGIARRPGGPS